MADESMYIRKHELSALKELKEQLEKEVKAIYKGLKPFTMGRFQLLLLRIKCCSSNVNSPICQYQQNLERPWTQKLYRSWSHGNSKIKSLTSEISKKSTIGIFRFVRKERISSES
jgi:hypothetical protein